MTPERILPLAALQRAGVGALLLGRIEAELGPVETWWRRRGARELIAAGVGPRLATQLADAGRSGAVERAVARLGTLGYACRDATEFDALAELPDPPLLLYVRGEVAAVRSGSVAIVGARRATSYGLRCAAVLGRELGARGVGVFSGLARGIDGAAHRGALDAGGFSAAVLGCGPDVDYPPEHRDLRRRLEEEGAVLTEYLPGTPPLKHHFPRRNRIIVAFAAALVVVEARIRSGTLTSVRWAADLGREVLVVPGPIDSPLSEGPLQLLREGATPIGGASDVLEALGEQVPETSRPKPATEIATTVPEGRVLALLGAGPVPLDDLVRLSGEAPGRLLTLLLGLEVRRLVERDAAMAYRLVATTGATTRSASP